MAPTDELPREDASATIHEPTPAAQSLSGDDEKRSGSIDKHADAEEKGEVAENDNANAAPEGEQEDPDAVYPTGLALGLLTLGLCLTTFVIALDNTIIATAIPHITTVFHSLDDVGW